MKGSGIMKKQVAKITVYSGYTPVTIRTYKKDDGAPYEIRIDNDFWATCENGVEVHEEINDIIEMYKYRYFPAI